MVEYVTCKAYLHANITNTAPFVSNEESRDLRAESPLTPALRASHKATPLL